MNEKILGLILSIQAEIEAMKLQNLLVGEEYVREKGYTPEHFFNKAEELRNAVAAHDDQF